MRIWALRFTPREMSSRFSSVIMAPLPDQVERRRVRGAAAVEQRRRDAAAAPRSSPAPGAVRWIASSAPPAAARRLDLGAREEVRLLAQAPEDDDARRSAGGRRGQLAQHRHHRGDAGAGGAEDHVARVTGVEHEEAVRPGHVRRSAPERHRHQVVGRLAFGNDADDEAQHLARVALRGDRVAAARDGARGLGRGGDGSAIETNWPARNTSRSGDRILNASSAMPGAITSRALSSASEGSRHAAMIAARPAPLRSLKWNGVLAGLETTS